MRSRYAAALIALLILGLATVGLSGNFAPAPQPSQWLDLPVGAILEGDEMPRLGANAIAVHPTRPVVVAGGNDGGILRSFDGGDSWEWLRGVLPDEYEVLRLTFAPDGELAAVLADASAYRSRDLGATWEWLRGASDVIYSPGYPDDRIIFAIGNGLWRSGDGGATWSEVLPATEGCPIHVALPPGFASGGPAYVPCCDHVLRSDDGGLTWDEVPNRDSGLFESSALTRLYAPDDELLIGIGA